MTYYDTIYPYGLNTEISNRSIKIFSPINNINDYSTIYPTLHPDLKINSRNTRGKSSSSLNVSQKINN